MYDLLIHNCHALTVSKDGSVTIRRNQVVREKNTLESIKL